MENGKPNGQGTLTWKYDEYVGEWKDGKRHGQGTYTRGKNKYVGDLKDGGYWNGTWYGKDGIIHGKSVNGKFTKK